MYGPGICGTFSLIPAVILLTLSFFVLVALQQIKPGALRGFGLAVFIILLFAIALLLIKDSYKMPFRSYRGGAMQAMPKQAK
jgi:hypothetical protein